MNGEAKNRGGANRKLTLLLLLMICAAGIIALLQVKESGFNLSDKPLVGEGGAAPNFSLPGIDGQMISLADYRGKVVLLNIWATWCPPCVEEMPSMEKLYQALKGEAFEILAVSLDESGVTAVGPFMQRNKLNFTALTDTAGTLKNLYQTTGVPESFIIDKQGNIVEKIIGPRDWASPGAIRYFTDLSRKK